MGSLLVDGQHDGVTGRSHVEPYDILYFLGKSGISGQLEGAQAMQLKTMRVPDALHGPQTDTNRLCDRASGPVRGVARRFRARQRQHLRHGFQRQRRLARLARLVAQQPIHALIGIALLPTPHRRSAGAAAAGNLQDWQSVGGMKNDPSPLHVFLRLVAISDQHRQPRAIFRRKDDADSLSHKRSIARFANAVNLMFASVH